jgi:hypothetical protein
MIGLFLTFFSRFVSRANKTKIEAVAESYLKVWFGFNGLVH